MPKQKSRPAKSRLLPISDMVRIAALIGAIGFFGYTSAAASAHKPAVSPTIITQKASTVNSKPKTTIVSKPATTPAPVVFTPVPLPAPTPAATVTKPTVTASPSAPKVEPVVTAVPASSVSTLMPVAPTTTATPSTPTTTTSGGGSGSSSASGSSSSSGSGSGSGSSNSTPPATTTGYTSTNWSGYFASSSSYTSIRGSWIATAPTGNNASTSADSTWIGIGGVTASDLIQVGTQNSVSTSGQVTASAFYELLPDYSKPVPGVTIAPGDSITAGITQVSGGQWTITITDTTNGSTNTQTVSYTSSLSSAEWIQEDPSYSAHRQIPFDYYGSTAFTSGSTTTADATISISNAGAQPITMVNKSGQTLSIPGALTSDGAGFSVTRDNTH